MTLIVGYMSATEQVLVADKKLTNLLTGELVDDAAYKIISFHNPDQGYQFAIAFTGLAILNSVKTVDWLIDILPKTMSHTTGFNEGVEQFKASCTSSFASARVGRKEWKRTTFVLLGRYSHSEAYPSEPFRLIISNCIDKNGNPTRELCDEFSHYLTYRVINSPPNLFHDLRCWGDLKAANPYYKHYKTMFRYLRKPISYRAKLELAARFIRRVGRSSTSVGKDVLGIVLPVGKTAQGCEWPEKKGRNETMPPLVFASGIKMFLDLPPSNSKQLTE